MATILLTGATGTVGQALVPSLKKRGHRLICLIRGTNPEQRIRAELGEHITDDDYCWSGDVTEQLCGVDLACIRSWRGKVDHLVHLAGSIKFDERLADDTQRMNVEGLRHVLALADELGSPQFHHMSTAYVAGNRHIFTEDDVDCGQCNFNAYERSKLEAEKIVKAWSGRKRIYRMSIMVGDSKTGKVSAFNGYYGFFTSFWRLLCDLRVKWQQDAERLQEQGITFTSEGQLFLPLVVRCSVESRLNLIPADWLADSMADLISLEPSHLVYHLVHPSPPRVQWVIEQSLKHMGITGLTYGKSGSDPVDRGLLRHLQRGLDKGLEQFLPYVTHGTSFSIDHVLGALGDRYVPPMPVDDSFLATMLDYAMSVNFGRSVPTPA
ncbi:MAG: SDR family NAD(P)-dependent oxidoreductase [Candidatus Andersenbacteria bacterium]